MTKAREIGSHVQALLTGVSDHGGEHLLEVENDLLQTTRLLGEAIEVLGRSFLDLHASLLKQEEFISMMLDSPNFPEKNKIKLIEIQTNIQQRINEAVTSLQFQDLTSQLINRTLQRSNGLRELLLSLGLMVDVIGRQNNSEDLSEVLKELNIKLIGQSKELKDILRKTVHQQSLSTGDIELF